MCMNNSFKIKPLNAMFVIIMVLSIIGLLSVASWALTLIVNLATEDLNSSESYIILETKEICLDGVYLAKEIVDENRTSFQLLIDNNKCGVK